MIRKDNASTLKEYRRRKLECKMMLGKGRAKKIVVQQSLTNLRTNSDINNLELNIDDYSPKCKFCVLQTKEVDVVLGNSWLKSIGKFTMNVDKKYIEFENLTNKIML
jgi:hypothetical protein